VNTFNRVVTILVLLKVILVSIAVALNKFFNFFVWKSLADKVISFATNQNIYLLGGVLIVIFAACIVLLVYEFRRRE